MTSLDAASIRQGKDLAASLRKADRAILDGLRKAIAQATEPVRDEVRAAARATLPKRGGMNEWAASRLTAYSPLSVGRDTVTAVITIELPGHDLRSLDRGRIFHPIYGRLTKSGKMIGPQIIKSGFVTDTIRGAVTARARKAIAAALDDTATQLAREAQ